MALKHSLFSSILLGSLCTVNAFALIEKRVSCEKGSDLLPQTTNTVADYQQFLDDNRITNVSGEQMNVRHLEEFFFEYNKFPESLREEMIENNASINIIAGRAVTEDPTWDAKIMTTFDQRNWSEVVGAGGFPYVTTGERRAYEKEVEFIALTKKRCSDRRVKCDKGWQELEPKVVVNDYPTRIVVDKLYTDQSLKTRSHGSVNLFLHEHAHSLDSLYSANGVSHSKEWQKIAQSDKAQLYMSAVCLEPSYCKNNINESFAELFAYYHACESSRQHMERNAPEIANYFKNLTRIKAKKITSSPVITKSDMPQEQDCEEEVTVTDVLSKLKIPKVKIPKLPFGL